MDKFLFLKFENAGFFATQKFTKDRVNELGCNIPRGEFHHYVEPITVNQIGNVLNKLMGERPVPTLRESLIKRNEEIFDLAAKGYLKINTIFTVNKTNGKNTFPSELMTMRKSALNSFNPQEIITWNRVRQLLSNELFFEFMAILNDIFDCDVFSTYSSNQAMNLIREQLIDINRYNAAKDPKKGENSVNMVLLNECIENEDFKEFINTKLNGNMVKFKKTPMIKYILGYKYCGFNSNYSCIDLVSFGIDQITRLDGEIIIPLDDYFYEKLRNGIGFATILDGGSVWIDKILDAEYVSEADIIGFRPISEISTETMPNK